jgi:hypothetical protein
VAGEEFGEAHGGRAGALHVQQVAGPLERELVNLREPRAE